MLIIDTLGVNKRIFNPNVDDQSKLFGVWDLTQSSVNYQTGFLNSRKIFTVTSDLTMRPDLISLYQIGDSKYCGSLMKINGISNPFSIDEGRKLFVLSPEMIQRTYDRKKEEISGQSISKENKPLDDLKKSQEDKMFKVSQGRKDFLEKSVKNKPPLILPPNVSQPGDRKFTRKGKVFTFAPDAGKGGFNKPIKR
jgi:hypothetical protein